LNKYLKKNAITSPWIIDKTGLKDKYSFIIVIPSFNEGIEIIPTLRSISGQKNINPTSLLVVIVINNPTNPCKNIFNENQITINSINESNFNFDICTIDAFKNYPLPKKKAGVGLARRIGFDLSLKFTNSNSILIALDADTLVEQNYLYILKSYFDKGVYNCIIPGIFHQKAIGQIEENAIRKYEKFLYSTANNLAKVNSPYGFITMGSAMAFTRKCYIKAGGIPPKKATEDFYFLQNVVKTSSVKVIKRKLVFPSSRISDRVYLGTGFRIHQAKQGYDLEKLYYNKEAFKILKNWLEIGNDGFKKSIDKILSNANQVNIKLPLFLINNNIEKTWNGLQLSSNNNKNFEHQFLCWFDGLKTHRLLKYFSNYPL
tara:strand:+ start:3289 stop:4407 length:1119 start_codon:yes stop_codon:yes gene_type:complete